MKLMPAVFHRKPLAIVIIIIFGLIYADISLVNHCLFRTYGWDLGAYNNATWDYSHFRWNANNILYDKLKNVLADHFEIYPIILSPFRFIFGTYVLLVVQIASILFGGYGVYRYLLLKTGNANLSILGMLYFFLSWGIYAALSFDYHNNVVAAMLVPWFLFYFEKRKMGLALFFFILIITGKENMALWAVFIGLALALFNLKDKQKRSYAIFFTITALFFFVALVKWIMPGLDSEHHKYVHFYYNTLGTDFGIALHTVITRPVYTFKLLFINNTGLSEYDRIKFHTHLIILAGGGWALFFRPKYLLMLIPIYCQKLFNDDPMRWGLGSHYMIEFVPIISIALFEVIHLFLKGKKASLAGGALCIITTVLSLYCLYHVKKINDQPVREDIFSAHHYQSDYNTAKVYLAINLIPANASLSTQSEFVPHVAFRDTIFMYPEISGARYLLLCRSSHDYRVSMAEHQARITEFLSSGEWQKIYDEDNILVLKRK